MATLAFVVFEGIIVFPPGIEQNPLSGYYLPLGIFIYRFFATLIVLKYKSILSEYSKTVSSQLQDSLNKYPDVINSTKSTRCKCDCSSRSRDNSSSFRSISEADSLSHSGRISSVDLLGMQSAVYGFQMLDTAQSGQDALPEHFVKGVHV